MVELNKLLFLLYQATTTNKQSTIQMSTQQANSISIEPLIYSVIAPHAADDAYVVLYQICISHIIYDAALPGNCSGLYNMHQHTAQQDLSRDLYVQVSENNFFTRSVSSCDEQSTGTTLILRAGIFPKQSLMNGVNTQHESSLKIISVVDLWPCLSKISNLAFAFIENRNDAQRTTMEQTEIERIESSIQFIKRAVELEMRISSDQTTHNEKLESLHELTYTKEKLKTLNVLLDKMYHSTLSLPLGDDWEVLLRMDASGCLFITKVTFKNATARCTDVFSQAIYKTLTERVNINASMNMLPATLRAAVMIPTNSSNAVMTKRKRRDSLHTVPTFRKQSHVKKRRKNITTQEVNVD